ncbi:phosphatidylglycerol lysyltransferase domain-containing protein [Sagittula sp.]|uniref:phosphatidylglycerol lysyltransferase domain-containing protein n=1 Tax=Sagittula sp. TaxID=2038081 RepID=UPI0040595CFD
MTSIIPFARRVAPRNLLRAGLPVATALLCLALLHDKAGAVDAAALRNALGAVAPAQWGLALIATAVSFWAIGRYDAVIHRHLGTGIDTSEAQRSGAAAIALAQVLGMGVVTGALARWRMLPGLGAAGAARVSALVALSFMSGLTVIIALSGLILPGAALPGWASVPILAGAAALAAASFFRRRFSMFGRCFHLPGLLTMRAILLLTLLDTLAAAFALHALMPPGTAPGYAQLLPAYLVALGAALVTGTPGGVGPFELALLTLLPQVPEADLLAAILAFRVAYYALPALLALLPLARPAGSGHSPASAPGLPAALTDAARAELGVARQNDARGLFATGASGAVVETGQSLTLLFGPVHGPLRALLPALAGAAAARALLPMAYKLDARDAAAARAAGWCVLRIADEARLDPAAFTTDGPAHRQLRRKLKQADKAGIRARHEQAPPLDRLVRIDADWCARHGGARGLTMGRFTPAYIAGQRVYVAERDGNVLAFITLHTGPREWVLDLMRHAAELPDGTMHALVTAALTDARAAGVPCLSLAAMPAAAVRENGTAARLRADIARRSGGDGLTRFKTAFAPRRAPLYAAAPSRAALIIGLADLAVSMRKASPMPSEPAPEAAAAIAFARAT